MAHNSVEDKERVHRENVPKVVVDGIDGTGEHLVFHKSSSFARKANTSYKQLAKRLSHRAAPSSGDTDTQQTESAFH